MPLFRLITALGLVGALAGAAFAPLVCSAVCGGHATHAETTAQAMSCHEALDGPATHTVRPPADACADHVAILQAIDPAMKPGPAPGATGPAVLRTDWTSRTLAPAIAPGSMIDAPPPESVPRTARLVLRL